MDKGKKLEEGWTFHSSEWPSCLEKEHVQYSGGNQD